MRIPEYLAVAQWAVLIVLGSLVIVVYRHLGRVLNRDRHTGTFGPAPGSKAAAFEYLRISDGCRYEFTPVDDEPALIAFVDPTCPACEELVESLGAAQATGELGTNLELGSMTSHLTREAYRATATPLLVAIGGDGVVRSAGPARQASDIHTYVRACLLTAPEATLAVVTGNADTRQEPEIMRSRHQ
jgi:hypothetical protein